MESEAGAQVAALDNGNCSSRPFSLYQFLPCHGRDGVSETTEAPLSGRLNRDAERPSPSAPEQNLRLGENRGSSSRHWRSWNWDGFSFLAYPSSSGKEVWRTGEEALARRENENNEMSNLENLRRESHRSLSCVSPADSCKHADVSTTEHKRKQVALHRDHTFDAGEGDDRFAQDSGCLALTLGGSSYSYTEDAGNSSQASKRNRSSSPGSQYPMCQVDGCLADLTQSKDYHRRHKVCEIHSKASKVLVHRLVQRFCQQCSRFHPLQEFDEIKRSCRRRLAGHNSRRRKAKPDVATASVSSVPDAVRGTDLFGILAILSQVQSKTLVETADGRTVEQDTTLPNVRTEGLASSVLTSLNRNASGRQVFDLDSPDHASTEIQRQDLKSQSELLVDQASRSSAALPGLQNGLRAQSSLVVRKNQEAQSPQQMPHVSHASLSQFSSVSENPEYEFAASHRSLGSTRLQNFLPPLSPQLPNGPYNLTDHEKLSSRPSFTSQCLTPENSGCVEAEIRGVNSARRVGIPCVEQNLFPVHSSGNIRIETAGTANASRSDDVAPVSDSNIDGYPAINPSEHDEWTHKETTEGSQTETRKHLQQTSDNSDSGSDQSPASSSSDCPEHTGRILFKLFNKDPEDLPLVLRAQVLEWLAHKPLDMESYIRPGCVLLTIFLTMPLHAWEELVRNLRASLKRLVSSSPSNFWSMGRILVQVDQQRVLMINGKVRMVKFLRSEDCPRLESVRPFAIVAGEETTLVVRGQNLVAGTKIVCAYQGKYWLQEMPQIERREDNALECAHGEECHDLQEHRVNFPGGPRNVLGRCFVEVEHGLLGNILPVIIADGAICTELRTLEQELDGSSASTSSCQLQSECSSGIPDSLNLNKENATKLLHELGWVFQRSCWPIDAQACLKSVPSAHYKSRFKALLSFAAERGWCAVMKKLLDILFNSYECQDDGSFLEIMQTLVEINLVHLAVKRKCRAMIVLLLQYIPDRFRLRGKAIFAPDVPGPAGLTPLHVAACLSDAEEIIDALTSDPFEVGLHSWRNARDTSGQTPEWYALNSGNLSYLKLVEKKLINRQAGDVTLWIGDHSRERIHGNLAKPNEREEIEGVANFKGLQVELPPWVSNPLHSSIQSSGAFSLCRDCNREGRWKIPTKVAGIKGMMHKPLMISMVAIATLCVCVTLFFKGPPYIGVYPFNWKDINYGAI